MEQEQFCFDFGTLPEGLLLSQTVTNPTDLLWNDGVRDTLRLCGEREQYIGSAASDYEKFRALCHAMPLLSGHPVQRRSVFILHRCFGIDLPLSAETCDRIWKTVAESLLYDPMSVADCVQKMLQNEEMRILLSPQRLQVLSNGAIPVLDGNRLTETDAVDWNSWQYEMKNTIARFANAGCSSAFFRMTDKICGTVPNVYHVEQALKVKKKSAEEMALLMAQTFRFLCAECISNGWTLLLHADCTGTNPCTFLARMKQSVGLPPIVWFTAQDKTRDELLHFGAQNLEGAFRCAVCMRDVPSDAELALAVSSYAARYPLGRLACFSGGDLRDVAFEHERWNAEKRKREQ